MFRKLVLLLLFLSLFSVDIVYAQTSKTQIYKVIDPSGNIHSLNVITSETLYNAYKNTKNPSTLDGFATPLTVKPIADSLRTLFTNDEVFVNQVLKWNRQHIYEVTDACYPAETLYTGIGDCDTFSYLVASVLIAGGVNELVLITYELKPNEYHMNLGVHLSTAPVNYGSKGLYWVSYSNKSYYIAECTDQTKDPTQDSYNLGNLPYILKDIQPKEVVPIVYQQDALGQVQSFYSNTATTTVSVGTTDVALTYLSPIIINGDIGINLTGETVSLYYSHDGLNWRLIDETTTVNGEYTYTWFIMKSYSITEWLIPEKLCIKAYWSGNIDYQGGESGLSGTFVLPFWLIMVTLLIVVVVWQRKKE